MTAAATTSRPAEVSRSREAATSAPAPAPTAIRLVTVVLVGTAGPLWRAAVAPGGDGRLAALIAAAAVAAAAAALGAARRATILLGVGVVCVSLALLVARADGVLVPVAAAAAATVAAFGSLVAWRITGDAHRRTGTAGLALGPLLLLGLRWARDPSPRLAGLLLLASLAILEWQRARPTAAARLEHRIAAGAGAVGRGLRRALLWAVGALVLVPLHLLGRAFGLRPLDAGWTTEGTAWVAVDGRRHHDPDGSAARPTSMGGRELAPAPHVRRRQLARTATAGLVLLGLLVAIAGPDLHRPSWLGGDDTTTATRDSFDRPFEDDAAFADAPWAADLRVDLLDAWNGLEFNAAAGGWQIRDVASPYVNVRDGERATIAPEAAGEPLTVWLLGGSAAFGAGQRDEHTIASELVRLADDDGRPIEVRNLAVPATVDWQTATLLLARLRWEDPPDLVVVYDGANDVALQDELIARGMGASDLPASLVDGQIDEILRDRAEESGERGSSLDPVATEPDPAPSPEEAGASIATRYLRGVDVMADAAADAGVPLVVLWQPDLRAKAPRSGADQETLDDLGMDDEAIARWAATTDVVRSRLADAGVIDLSGALDGTDEAVYWDAVHTNELGARLAAEAVYEQIAPQLDQLAADR